MSERVDEAELIHTDIREIEREIKKHTFLSPFSSSKALPCEENTTNMSLPTTCKNKHTNIEEYSLFLSSRRKGNQTQMAGRM